jgi:pilus assembly protein Flp/PilA
MMYLMNRMHSLVKNEEGQDLLEYALLTALIALAAVFAIQAAGVEVNRIFAAITGELSTAP